MPKGTTLSPALALKTRMDEYQLNPSSLAKAINLSQSGIRQIVIGKTRISAAMSLRFAKFFGDADEYWLDIQSKADLAEAAKDANLQAELKAIVKAKKPAPGAAPKAKRGAAAKAGAPRRGRKPAAAKEEAAAAAAKPRRGRRKASEIALGEI